MRNQGVGIGSQEGSGLVKYTRGVDEAGKGHYGEECSVDNTGIVVAADSRTSALCCVL